MKRTLSALTAFSALALMLFACKTTTTKVDFTEQIFNHTSAITEINIKYPVATGKNSEAITSINNTILNSLLLDEYTTLDGYVEEAKKMEADSIPYQVATEWNGYINESYTSINIYHYIYAGGAHGGTNLITLTFDNATGNKIDLRSQITDTVAFQKILATEYATQNELDINVSPGDIGYFTELTKIPIPTTMILTDSGLKVMYSQYEIACYAVGITEVTIPYDKISAIFELKPGTLTPMKQPNTQK